MPHSDIIIISDNEQSVSNHNYGYTSDDSDIVVLSVSSPPPQPPSSSQPSSGWGDISQIWDPSDAEEDNHEEDDMEFLDVRALINASRNQSTGASASQSQARSSTSTSPGSRKRKSSVYSDGNDSDDSLIVEAPKKPAKRRKKTEEEKAREKAEKEAQKLAKKEEAKRKKEAAAAEKAAQKIAKQAHKEVNKLVINKKMTLKDMIIELSPDLLNSPLYAPLAGKMREFQCPLSPIAANDSVVENPITSRTTNILGLDIKLIRWKRRVAAVFNEHTRQWDPLPENERYTRTEGTYLIYVTGHDVVRSLAGRNLPLGTVPSIAQQVSAVRAALGPKHHVHVMLCGWKSASRGKPKELRDRVEWELVGLQVRESVHVEQVADEDEAVNWIYNMTADLGIKPYKLIERSHLPFCAQASSAFKVGKSDTDTMTKMFAQLPRLTEPAAQAVVRDYKTINQVMEGYARAEYEGRNGSMMLANVVIPRTKSGREAPRALNKALSERLYEVLWGQDPKALIN